MSDIAIRVENLGKLYQIGAAQKRHDTLRDVIGDWIWEIGNLRNRFRPPSSNVQPPTSNSIWALNDVSFEVKRGEVVGIIGRNGAGKSTLLKILSRITEPTKGRAIIDGRVGSLLEVGTGFHPELTGRENIYLNGAILGMKRTEIDHKFDEIVAFAEIDKFLDTPVKRYSSGMYVRLAFAVAAHLEPEILLVDEVLAVGDAAFQSKCLGKMGDVAREGRTVLFISHNMGAVQSLCQRGILIEQGRAVIDTGVNDAVSAYMSRLESAATRQIASRTDRTGKGEVRLESVQVSMGGAEPSGSLVTGRPAKFVFTTSPNSKAVACTFTLYDMMGRPITNFNSSNSCSADGTDETLKDCLVCEVDQLLLVPGKYRLNAAISSGGELQDHVEAASFIEVSAGEILGRPISQNGRYGSVVMRHRWKTPGKRNGAFAGSKGPS